MTIEEAIDIIRQYKCCNEHIEACEMAIDALETLESEPMITRCKDCFFEDCKAKEFYGENGFCSIGRRKRNEINRR